MNAWNSLPSSTSDRRQQPCHSLHAPTQPRHERQPRRAAAEASHMLTFTSQRVPPAQLQTLTAESTEATAGRMDPSSSAWCATKSCRAQYGAVQARPAELVHSGAVQASARNPAAGMRSRSPEHQSHRLSSTNGRSAHRLQLLQPVGQRLPSHRTQGQHIRHCLLDQRVLLQQVWRWKGSNQPPAAAATLCITLTQCGHDSCARIESLDQRLRLPCMHTHPAHRQRTSGPLRTRLPQPALQHGVQHHALRLHKWQVAGQSSGWMAWSTGQWTRRHSANQPCACA